MSALPQSQASTAELQAMLELHHEPAIIIGLDYRIVAANRAYRDLYGDAEALSQRHCYDVSHHFAMPCDQAGEHCPLRATLASGTRQRVFHLHYTPGGQEHVDVETHPIHDADGNIRYLVEVLHHNRVASAKARGNGLVGRSPAFSHMLAMMQRVAPSETAVLLQGETGTGKELVAQAVHAASRRHKGPFVPLECSGLTESLFESELFGHEKGAFTGAMTRKIGLVEAAYGGTLFLDEVGDIPLGLQVKLLRLLETGTFRRVGSVEAHKADFRLVCASHRDLKEMVEQGTFRRDLFYRLSTFPIALPPLRKRVEDLPLLIDSLLRRLDLDPIPTVHPNALAYLQRYAFPGNIRELRNILERATLLADADIILPEHLPEEVRGDLQDETPQDGILTLEAVERRYLQEVAGSFTGDNRALAKRLGISERTLYRKLQGVRS